VGSYPITAAGAADSDYTIAYVPGTLTVTRATLTLTVTANNASRQYSDPNPTFTYTITGFANGDPSSVVSGSPSLTTTATTTSPVGTYPITAAQGTLAAANYSFTLVNGTLSVTPEDARAYYTGLLYVPTSSPTSTSATVTLATTVTDITAVTGDPAWDPYPGDIRTTTVQFLVYNQGGTLVTSPTAPVGLVNSGDTTVGTATVNVTLSVDASGGTPYTVRTVVTGNYTRNSQTDDVIVNVIQPQAGSIAGGGFTVNPPATASPKSAGQFAGDPGLKTHFGFNVKYNKGGTNLQGNVNLIDRSGGRVYQFKCNALTALNVLSSTHATFTGKASVQDITDPNNVISIDGNATLQMELYDNGPGSTDTIGITVLNKSGGLYFSNYWNGTKTVQQILGGGNVQVIPAQFLAGAPAAGLPAPAPLTPEQLQPIVAEAKARWRAAGVSPQKLAALDRLAFRIEDLPGNDLGMESEGVITISRTAAGYGWFVDPTPGDDAEFAPSAVNSPAHGHVDLLSVVAHEMGHVLGYFEDGDAANTVMSEDLPVGVRRVPKAAASPTSPAASLVIQPASAHGSRALGSTVLTTAAAVTPLGQAQAAVTPAVGQRTGAALTAGLAPALQAGQPAEPSFAATLVTVGQTTAFGPASAQPAGPPAAHADVQAAHAQSSLSARQPSSETLDLLFADLDLLQEALTNDVTRWRDV
jgi:hypothetical protein